MKFFLIFLEYTTNFMNKLRIFEILPIKIHSEKIFQSGFLSEFKNNLFVLRNELRQLNACGMQHFL